jgi:hypothetical protein
MTTSGARSLDETQIVEILKMEAFEDHWQR